MNRRGFLYSLLTPLLMPNVPSDTRPILTVIYGANTGQKYRIISNSRIIHTGMYEISFRLVPVVETKTMINPFFNCSSPQA